MKYICKRRFIQYLIILLLSFFIGGNATAFIIEGGFVEAVFVCADKDENEDNVIGFAGKIDITYDDLPDVTTPEGLLKFCTEICAHHGGPLFCYDKNEDFLFKPRLADIETTTGSTPVMSQRGSICAS